MKTNPSNFTFLSLIGLALCLVPFQYFPWIPGADVYDNQRLLVTACGLLAASIVMYSFLISVGVSIDLGKNRSILIGGFLFAGVVASFLAFSPKHAFFETATFALLLMLSWLVAECIRAHGDRALDRILLFCGMASAVYLIVHFGVFAYALKTGIQPKSSHLFFGYNNIRFFNHVQTISLPLLGLFALRLDDPFRRFFWLAITALWWALLYLSAGRGSLLGLAGGILLTWFLLRHAAWPWVKCMFFAALAGMAVFLVLYVWLPRLRHLEPFSAFFSIAKRSVDNPTSSRGPLWERAIDLMMGSPLFGVGPGHFAHYARDLNIAAHPHNWIFQIGSEWGLFALIALCGLAFSGITSIVKIKHDGTAKDQFTQSALLTASFAIIIDGLVSGLLVFPGSQLWLAVFLGIAWGWCSAKRPYEDSFRWMPTTGMRAIAIAVIGCCCVVIVYFIISQLPAISMQSEIIKSGTLMIPRLFLRGFF